MALGVPVGLSLETAEMVATAEMLGHPARRLSPQAAMAAMAAMVASLWEVAVAWLDSQLPQAQARQAPMAPMV